MQNSPIIKEDGDGGEAGEGEEAGEGGEDGSPTVGRSVAHV